MDKDKFDIDAEREGTALKQQGCESNQRRIRKEQEYNKTVFDKLFKR